MAMPLLQTKLYIPPVRPEWIPRPHLIERVNAGLSQSPSGFGRKLTLVSAPAGFGKTTLLSSWVAAYGRPVAWLSLDAEDNDPARFWSYFIAALQRSRPDVGQIALAALQSPQPPSPEVLLTGLINTITETASPIILILDDFHQISASQIHDALSFLLDNMPPQMHLILSSRTDPPWPLARLRARGQMIELRALDLRFTAEEVATLLNDALGLGLSSEDIAALHVRTEGWIAGLQMAALSMQGKKTYDSGDMSAFVKVFSGSHRFILDYLVEEVLSQQSADIQAFLLQTSILDRLTAPLCNAVTERNDAQEMLPFLDQANLFLVPLDDERRWYRYHHLFADLLRSHLEQTDPDLSPSLRRRASAWYEEHSLIAEAVSQALAGGDMERTERLVARNALAAIYQGGLATVARWLEALPDEMVHSRPWLCVAHAWVLTYAGHLDQVEPRLQEAEAALPSALTSGQLDQAEMDHIAGHIAAIRTYAKALQGELSSSVKLAREALSCLPEADLPVRGCTAMLLGCALRSLGDLEGAAQSFDEALAASTAAGDIHLAVDVLWEQGLLHIMQGQLHSAMSSCQHALRIASEYARRGGRQLPVTGYTHTLISNILRERNELEEALHHARTGFKLCQQWGQADALVMNYYSLAALLQTLGDPEEALALLQEAKQVARKVSPAYVIQSGAQEVRIHLARGDVSTAARWAQESGLDPEAKPSLQYSFEYRTLAKILLAQGRPDEALKLVKGLLDEAEARGAQGHALKTLVLQARIHQEQGKTEPALAALEKALAIAEAEGYVRAFIDEGAPMEQLLRQAIARGVTVDYASKLLATLQSEATGPDRPTQKHSPPLEEPLSERELEVLRLLLTAMSSTEIARLLVIAPSTVRSHIKSIYGKLGVHSRRDAVQRAKELGLL